MKSSYFFRKKRVECRLLARYAKAGDTVRKGDPILILEVSGALVVLRAAYEAKILFIKDQLSNVERNDVLFEEEVSMDGGSKSVDVLHTVEWKESDESSARPEPKSMKEIEHRPTLSDILGKKVVRGSYDGNSGISDGGHFFSKKSRPVFLLVSGVFLLCFSLVMNFDDKQDNLADEEGELSVRQVLVNDDSILSEKRASIALAPGNTQVSTRAQFIPGQSELYLVDRDFLGDEYHDVPDYFSASSALVDQDNNFLVGFDLDYGVVIADGLMVRSPENDSYCKVFDGKKSHYLKFQNLFDGEGFELPLFECNEVDFQKILRVRFTEDEYNFWKDFDEQRKFGPIRNDTFIVSKEYYYVEADDGSRKFVVYGVDDFFPLEQYTDKNGVACPQPGIDGIKEVADFRVKLLSDRTLSVEEFARVKEDVKVVFDVNESFSGLSRLDCLPAREWENRRLHPEDY